MKKCDISHTTREATTRKLAKKMLQIHYEGFQIASSNENSVKKYNLISGNQSRFHNQLFNN